MHVLISEMVCGGGIALPGNAGSLQQEGWAMLQALIDDIVRLPEAVQVSTILHPTLTRHSSRWHAQQVQVAIADSPAQEKQLLCRLATQCDATLLIAPELNGALEHRVRLLSQRGVRLLNCTAEAVALTSDKWALFQHLSAHQIPTIPTAPVSTRFPGGDLVVKRRDGAGSTGMRRITTSQDWTRHWQAHDPRLFLMQPFLPGSPHSLTALFANGVLQSLWPAGEQHLSDNGTFSYQGGRLEAAHRFNGAMHALIRQTASILPGLHGLVGFDLLVSDTAEPPLTLVEVNPRLTTSYLGYRQLTSDNLAAWCLQPDRPEHPKFHGAVQFRIDGPLERLT
jgi:predicted ATP-grasp superfamily ATP-dependent carboligase